MGLPAIESGGRSPDTEALYREHGTAVTHFCRSLLRDRAEAEDATQQVFLSAHRALLNGSTPREPRAWLLTVARHECHARFRQRAVSPLPTADVPDATSPDAAVHVLRAGEIAEVWAEVGRMPPAQREVFLLREIRGLSYGQLAAELSLSPPSVRSLLLRARLRLRHRLRDVVAGLGGAPWIQSLVRFAAGGEGASPVPAATKAAAVGLGALALGGGGHLARVSQHASRTPGQASARQQTRPHLRRAATPAGLGATVGEDRPLRGAARSGPEPKRRSSGSRRSGTDSSGLRQGNGDLASSSGEGAPDSGHDGSGETTAVTQPTSDGSGGGTSGSTSTTSGRDDSGSGDSGSSGSGSSGSSSDGSSTTPTTTTTTTSSGSGSDGSSSGGGDGGHDGG